MSEGGVMERWAEREGPARLRALAARARARAAETDPVTGDPRRRWACPDHACVGVYVVGETCPECLERWAEELEQRASR